MRDRGRLMLWRKLESDWKWKNPLHRAAWLWMVMKAAYAPHNGLQRGQFYFSISQGPKEWGMSLDQTRRFLKKCEKGYSGQDPDIIWHRGRPGVKGSVIATSSATSSATSGATSRGIITLLNYDKYNPPQRQGATSGAASDASSIAAIEKESIRKESKEVHGQPSADGKQCEDDHRQKTKKVKSDRHLDTKPTTDHIWSTYKQKKDFKPKVSGGFWRQIDSLVREYGGANICAAWDIYLADEGKFARDAGHSPQVFVGGGTINKYLSAVKERERTAVPSGAQCQDLTNYEIEDSPC